MTNTNFQNLYKSDDNYQTDRDSVVGFDENVPLQKAVQNAYSKAGNYDFLSDPVKMPNYTIGFGYDLSQQTGANIAINFAAAGIGYFTYVTTIPTYHLMVDGNDYGSAVQNYNSGPGYDGTTLDVLNSDLSDQENPSNPKKLAPLSLTHAQASLLLDQVMPAYEARLIKTINNTGGTSQPDSVAQINKTLATGQSSLHETLIAGDFNTGNVFRPDQQNYLVNDDLTSFIQDQFYNHPFDKSNYASSIENRRLYDFCQPLGLTLSGPTNQAYDSNGDENTNSYSAIQFNTNITAAAYVFSTLVY